MDDLPLWPLMLASVIEFAGALIMTVYITRAIYSLVITSSMQTARFLVASGAIAGLSFKTAAMLLKTLELETWNQIGIFLAVLALRMILKGAFEREQRLLRT